MNFVMARQDGRLPSIKRNEFGMARQDGRLPSIKRNEFGMAQCARMFTIK
jgi:hypothetical protein